MSHYLSKTATDPHERTRTLVLPLSKQLHIVVAEIMSYGSLLYQRLFFQACFDFLSLSNSKHRTVRNCNLSVKLEWEIRRLIYQTGLLDKVDLTEQEIIETGEEFFSLFYAAHSRSYRLHFLRAPRVDYVQLRTFGLFFHLTDTQD